MNAVAIRENYLARSPANSVTRVVSEAVIAEFDQHGLGSHKTFLTMLEKAVDPEGHYSDWKKAKTAAYSVLGKARAAVRKQLTGG